MSRAHVVFKEYGVPTTLTRLARSPLPLRNALEIWLTEAPAGVWPVRVLGDQLIVLRAHNMIGDMPQKTSGNCTTNDVLRGQGFAKAVAVRFAAHVLWSRPMTFICRELYYCLRTRRCAITNTSYHEVVV